MEELYRFLLLRSPEELDAENPATEVQDLSESTPFQDSLRTVSLQDDRIFLAENFQETTDFVGSLEGWPLGQGLLKIAHAYDLGTHEELPVAQLLVEVGNLIGQAMQGGGNYFNDAAAAESFLTAQVNDPAWIQKRSNLKDSILAIRESNARTRHLHQLVAALNAMYLVQQLVETDQTAVRPGALLRATLFLPGVRPLEAGVLPEASQDPDPNNAVLARAQYDQLKLAIDELLRVPASELEVIEGKDASDPADPNDPTGATDGEDLASFEKVVRTVHLGRANYDRLSEQSRNTLADYGVDTTEKDLFNALDILRSSQKNLSYQKDTSKSVFAKGTSFKGLFSKERTPENLRPPRYSSTEPPQTTGQVSPLGLGELMVVRQQLKRYEGGDIAHIENVLQGEVKLREHRSRQLTEDTFFEEEEIEQKEEASVESTSRFELRNEVQKQIETAIGSETGLKVHASYGPTVEIDADSRFSYKNAQSENRSRASNISKELVERAATSYTEKFRRSKTRKVVSEIEELNRHSLDASNATGHVTGVYQWINKVYQSQVFDYGLRVMYEFMVPEPAAFYIWALGQANQQGEGLVAPVAFDLTANDIDEWNYAELAAIYDAVDMPVPPEPFVTVDSNKSGGINPEKGPMVGTDSISLPEGYEYLSHNHTVYISGVSSDNTRGFNLSIGNGYSSPGTLPIAYQGWSIRGFSYYVHILCRRTNNAMEKWRMKAWEALQAGHLRQVAAYEDRLAELLTQSGIEIKGRNPYFNRKSERRELQKSCIGLFTGTHPLWLDGILDTAYGPFPQPSASAKQGTYVRFMEQAFEWENMNFVLYPYYWARSEKWLQLMNITDVDPEFQEFLTSGFARVVVPVRPGFESNVEYFRQTGQIWNGGKLPDITDPDYLPIAEEIKARQQAPGQEIPVGEPWDVLLPTELVKLRPDNSLPEWEQQADGTWKEKPTTV